ncbi:SMI1/KNR4 family protein [Leptospira interrogans serovar Canicola]|nr:SMI1/KNR4 family protein [Leptospira interrogans serovar Canicola]
MNITNIFKNVWTIQPGTNLNAIQKIESIFKVTFPEDYKQILLWSNGGEGKVGNRYLSLW